jgi:3-hydroxyisobutyrate dehydrogenase
VAHIAFIGLGKMGRPMAANLVRAGYDVRGFDLLPMSRDDAAKEGVSIATSAKETLEGADVVITMLPGGQHVLSAWVDLLPHATKGTLFIDSSTIDVDGARRIHELAGKAGMLAVDAPVSGGTAGAKAGTLTFMCGAAEAAFAAAKPILEKMGRKIILCGGAGAGQAAKICNNLILGATMIATAEAFVLAEKLGLSHQALFDVASTSSGQSWSLTNYCPVPGLVPGSPANNNYRPGFAAALMLKDLKLAQEAAANTGAVTPIGAAATQLYALYNAWGEGSADFSGIINMIRGKSEIRGKIEG